MNNERQRIAVIPSEGGSRTFKTQEEHDAFMDEHRRSAQGEDAPKAATKPARTSSQPKPKE